jgi:hypothetical protein
MGTGAEVRALADAQPVNVERAIRRVERPRRDESMDGVRGLTTHHRADIER